MKIKGLSMRVQFCRAMTLGVAVVALGLFLTPCFAADDLPTVVKSFEVFHHDWLQKLNAHCSYGKEKVELEKEPQGSYKAKYRVLSEAKDSEVKPTGDKGTPYVGILKYEEATYTSKGDTPEQAKQGPFEIEREVVITEIFRYSAGKWIY